jgi:hypothetical protein
VATAVFVAALCLAIVLGLWQYIEQSRTTVMLDFRSFYCGADVAARGFDPYLQEPLYACESHHDGSWLIAEGRNIALPAPLPPYALAFFVPFTSMAFPTASAVWTIVLALSLILTTIGLRRLTSFDTWALAALVFSVDGVFSLTLGQVAPLALAGFVWAGVSIEDRNYVAAAVALALAALEPHVIVAAIVSLLVWERRSRLPLVILGVVLFALSYRFGGLGRMIEYVYNVLPAHAVAGLNYPAQLALTPLLYHSGINAKLAVEISSLQSLTFAVIGILTARRVAAAYSREALLLFWPSGLMLLGGTFLHPQQVAFILPLATVIAASRRYGSWAAAAALVILSIPWLVAISQPQLLGVGMLSIFLVSRICVRLPLSASLIISFAVIAITMAGFYFLGAKPLLASSALPAWVHVNPSALAEASWKIAMQAYNSYNNPGMLVARVLTWTGMTLACASVLLTFLKSPRRSPAL